MEEYSGRSRPFMLFLSVILAGIDILRTPADSPGLFWKVILYAGVLYFLSSFQLFKEEDHKGVTG